jgi:hypothetical protein
MSSYPERTAAQGDEGTDAEPGKSKTETFEEDAKIIKQQSEY